MDLGDGVVIAEPQVELSKLVDLGLIDTRARYQKKLTKKDVFPFRDDGLCPCGCGGEVLPPQRRWHRVQCGWAAYKAMCVIHSQTDMIHVLLVRIFGRKCAKCDGGGCLEVDHKVEIADGGGGLWLYNFQLLCKPCHVSKTTASRRARA